MERFKFAAAVTPNNSADNILDGDAQACQSRIIYCAVAGNLSFVDGKGDTATIAIVANIHYPISTHRVLATATTATGIVALW